MQAQAMGVFGALSGILGGGVLGFALGRRFRAQQARVSFWAACGISLAVGMVAIFFGNLLAIEFLTGAGLGLMTGGLNGLRWGMGRLSDAPRRGQEPAVPGEIERRGGIVPPPDEQPLRPEERSREEGRRPTPVG